MKIKTSSFAAALAVLLMLCLVFMAPVGAVVSITEQGNYQITSVNDLQSALTQIESANNGDYVLELSEGSYELTEDMGYVITINQKAVKNITIKGAGIDKTIIKGGIFVSGGSNRYTSETLTITQLTLDNSGNLVSDTGTGGVILFGSGSENRYSHNIKIESVKIIGAKNNNPSSKVSGIYSGANGGVFGTFIVKDVQILNCFAPVNGYLNDNVEISGCTFSDCEEGVNFQGGGLTSATIKDSTISSDTYAIRIGTANNAFGDLTLTDNDLSGGTKATIIFRASFTDTNNIEITGNAITGNQLMADETVNTYDLNLNDADLSDNFWGDGGEPTPDKLGGIELPESTTFLDENPFVPPTPSQPTTSSSSGTPTPGAYYNYPRTVTDGGLVEFGTSKVVKSVTLPAGSSGKVNLHIDSTAYWPLAVDSEFTFDISVENLGEGTSYISFKIAESKLTTLELTAADVGVYHNVNGEWVKLTVTYKIEEGSVIYTAETDSFSPFKLVIEEGAAVQKEEVTPSEPVVDEPVIPDVPQDVPGEILPEIPGVQDEPEEPSSPAPLLGLLAALGAAVVLRRK